MKYTIRKALHEEAREGWVWVKGIDIQARFGRVQHGKNVITCEIREIDDNFTRRYDRDGDGRIPIGGTEACAVLNRHYRKHLGIGDNDDSAELDITSGGRLLCYLRHHPQPALQWSFILALVSVGLGVLSVVLAVLV